MEYMGLILFLWIVGGSSVGLYILDRMNSGVSTRVPAERRYDAPRETA